MTEEDKPEDKSDTAIKGESPGYISLQQARTLAMRTAAEVPGNYGQGLTSASMVYDVAEQKEGNIITRLRCPSVRRRILPAHRGRSSSPSLKVEESLAANYWCFPS